MSISTSMWLGILFLILAVAAVLLQAWLWGPKFWNEKLKKTEAPKAWLRVHAGVGYLYGGIYVVMMWNMFPRLWEYQYELPARSVIHAVIAIVLGVLLITKIIILLFFRHFEEALPRFGFGILVCTVTLISLSVPHAARALDLQGRIADPDNIARVEQILTEIDLGEGAPDVAELTSKAGLQKGRDLLVNKCVSCHDMRTILLMPRTGARWHELVVRMQDKPDPFSTDPLTDDEVPYVTAYLVAITPDIQASRKRKVEEERTREAVEQKTLAALAEAPPRAASAQNNTAPPRTANTDAASVAVDTDKGKAILDARCVDCHELDEIESFGGAEVAGWAKVITDMVEEGAEITDDEARVLAPYLATIYPKQ
jgi:cytochrome c5